VHDVGRRKGSASAGAGKGGTALRWCSPLARARGERHDQGGVAATSKLDRRRARFEGGAAQCGTGSWVRSARSGARLLARNSGCCGAATGQRTAGAVEELHGGSAPRRHRAPGRGNDGRGLSRCCGHARAPRRRRANQRTGRRSSARGLRMDFAVERKRRGGGEKVALGKIGTAGQWSSWLGRLLCGRVSVQSWSSSSDTDMTRSGLVLAWHD